MRRKAKTLVPPVQEADFKALPTSIQRKCFSSVDQHGSGSSLSSRASSSIPFRPSLSLGPQRRSRKEETVLSGLDISQREIEFFLSLPTKLRKLYYSKREQQALQEFQRAQQRFSDFRFGFQRDPDSTSEQASFGPSTQEKERNAESRLRYLDAMSPPASRSSNPVRRTMSLTTSSMHYSSSSAVLMSNPSGFAIAPAPAHQRQHSSSLSGRRSLQTPTPPVFDPEATHYRDPEARKKLRTYLASPQKFDEAIEFGFPSTSGNDTVTPRYQLPPIASHSRKFSRDMQTFLRDGKLSFFEDKQSGNQGLESDEDSVADMESPTTPSSTGHSFRLHSRQISHSKLSTDGSSVPSPTHLKGNLNREMTLRMTLTRPDLRASDDHLYGWQPSSPKALKDDPLALEDLVLTDDMTGTQGPFYVKPKPRGNLVSRMLKRASLKGR